MKITQAMFFVYAVVYAIFTLVHSSVREPTMALKTDREIASLKADKARGWWLLSLVVQEAVYASRFEALDAQRHGSTGIA